MTDRIEELQRLHEAATKGPWSYDDGITSLPDEEEHRGKPCIIYGQGMVGGLPILCDVPPSGRDDRDSRLIVAMRNALPALLRVARAAKHLRTAMTTPPKGYGDGHQGYWWTAATEKAAEEVAEAVDEMEKP